MANINHDLTLLWLIIICLDETNKQK